MTVSSNASFLYFCLLNAVLCMPQYFDSPEEKDWKLEDIKGQLLEVIPEEDLVTGNSESIKMYDDVEESDENDRNTNDDDDDESEEHDGINSDGDGKKIDVNDEDKNWDDEKELRPDGKIAEGSEKDEKVCEDDADKDGESDDKRIADDLNNFEGKPLEGVYAAEEEAEQYDIPYDSVIYPRISAP